MFALFLVQRTLFHNFKTGIPCKEEIKMLVVLGITLLASLSIVTANPCENVICEDGLVCSVFTLTSSPHAISRCVDPHMPSRCQQPMDTGPCKASKEKWYFDTQTNQCLPFLFGGCEGNQNRYESEGQCRVNCIPEVELEERVVCPLAACMMACQFGFEKDSQGCDLCRCAIPPAPFQKPECTDILCAKYCPHGHQKDEMGCTICKCREHPPCLEMECTKDCVYGFVTGRDGCPLCECAANPCSVVTCPEEHECIAMEQAGGFWEPTCIALHESRPWCAGRPECMNHCQLGHQSDQYGCNTCQCMDEPPTCVQVACTVECEFGNAYDANGCMTCDCLEDPCKNHTCKNAGLDVCEAVHPYDNCNSCPAKDKCMFSRDVRQARIRFQYAHDSYDDHVSMEELTEVIRVQVFEVLTIDDDYIKSFRVTRVNNNAVLVEYYIITFGNTDLVDVTEEFIDDLDDQELHVTYNDIKFVPAQHTISHRYYSAHSYPDDDGFLDDLDDADSDVMATVIIVAACAAGVVALLVIIAICCLITRSKGQNKGQNKGRQNPQHIYNKVPANDNKVPQRDSKVPKRDSKVPPTESKVPPAPEKVVVA